MMMMMMMAIDPPTLENVPTLWTRELKRTFTMPCDRRDPLSDSLILLKV
jgi:hypothetical protein